VWSHCGLPWFQPATRISFQTQTLRFCCNFFPLDPLSPVPVRCESYSLRLCEDQERGRVVHFGGTARCDLTYLFALLFSLKPHEYFQILLSRTDHDNITMTSKELPRLMKSVSYEHASTARNLSYSNFGHGEYYYLLSSHLRNELYSLCEYTEHSFRQIPKRIHREASQGERGPGDSGWE
jgi:hypothetical protein